MFSKIKRILIVSTKLPFSKGGDSVQVDTLAEELSKSFEVEKIYIPFSTDPDLLIQQIEAIRNLKFDYGDLAITLRPFSYAIRHHNKIVWFMHHIRYFYDLWDTNFVPFKNKDKYLKLREKIIQYDNQFLRESKKIFSISNNVKRRLKYYNNIDSEVIYPPLYNLPKYQEPDLKYQDFFFFPSRLADNKRQHLVIQALKYTKGNFKLIIAGQKEESYFNREILPLINDAHIKDKIEVMDYIDQEKKFELYLNCLAVIFTPYDEDYGYITPESFYFSKCLITTSDSGGPLEFVENQKTGIIIQPDPKLIAQAMDELYFNKEKAISMGKQAKEYLDKLDLSWPNTIKKLTSNNNILSKIFEFMVSKDRD